MLARLTVIIIQQKIKNLKRKIKKVKETATICRSLFSPPYKLVFAIDYSITQILLYG